MWSFREYLCYFLIYAFLGWCCEVVFAAAMHGKFVNRGFLNGPVCPVYGFGVCLVVFVLYPIKENLLALFLGSMLLTSAIELVAGYLMEKCFHHRWWDYSKRPLNIGGYVCLLFSLLWGLACVLVIDVAHPLVAKLVSLIPVKLTVILLAVLYAVLLADLVVTVLCVLKLNRRLRKLDEAAERLRVVSDSVGESLAEGTIAVKKRNEAFRAALREHKPGFGERRLLKAFPDIRSERYAEAMQELKRRLLGENKDAKAAEAAQRNAEQTAENKD